MDQIQREIELSKIFEGSWSLFMKLVTKLARSSHLRKMVLLATPSWQRPFIGLFRISYDQPIKKLIAMVMGDKGLNETDARLAVMTSYAPVIRLYVEITDEGVPFGYYKVMEAFHATLPWNRTGFNKYTMSSITDTDIKDSIEFLETHLGKEFWLNVHATGEIS